MRFAKVYAWVLQDSYACHPAALSAEAIEGLVRGYLSEKDLWDAYHEGHVSKSVINATRVMRPHRSRRKVHFQGPLDITIIILFLILSGIGETVRGALQEIGKELVRYVGHRVEKEMRIAKTASERRGAGSESYTYTDPTWEINVCVQDKEGREIFGSIKTTDVGSMRRAVSAFVHTLARTKFNKNIFRKIYVGEEKAPKRCTIRTISYRTGEPKLKRKSNAPNPRRKSGRKDGSFDDPTKTER